MRHTEPFDDEVWNRVKYLTENYSDGGNKTWKDFYYFTKVNSSMIFCICSPLIGLGIGFLGG